MTDINQLVETNVVELDKKHHLHPASNPRTSATKGPSVVFSKGKGIYVTNELDGKEYIDAMSMLWNVNIGHGQEEITEAAKAQLDKIAYSSAFKGFTTEATTKLAAKLAELAPGDLNAVFFTSGGSESNDTNLKLARFYWGMKGQPEKRNFIALDKAYHGVTVAAQTATGIPAFHEFAGFNIDGVFRAKSHLTACEKGDKTQADYASSIRGVIEREGAENIAGVILEPVQGAGGVNVPPEGYLQAVRDLCNEYNILMIADEVICGFGRTGKMFGVDNWDVVPDMMAIAKGISSGYAQLGGAMVNDEIRDTIQGYDGVLAHGFTYSGHPLSCAIALKNIEIIERDNLVGNAKAMEAEVLKGFKYLEEKHAIVTNTRCIGLLGAIDFYEDRENGKMFASDVFPANFIVEECFKRNMIIRAVGAHNQTLAFAPPLTVTKKEIGEMITIVDEAITAFTNSRNS
jgi:putrescine aminotransferase